MVNSKIYKYITVYFLIINLISCATGIQQYSTYPVDVEKSILRLDGFYYYKTGKKVLYYGDYTFNNHVNNDSITPQLLENIKGVIFYENGVLKTFDFTENSYKSKPLSSKILNIDSSYVFKSNPNFLLSWGRFKFIRDSILFEYPSPSSGGKAKFSTYMGKIINDTTIIITDYYSEYTNEKTKVNFVYKFHKLKNKPAP